MAKLHRTSRAPDGAFDPLRNTRLYGDRDTQTEGTALRSRGCPNPDRAYAGTRSRADLRAEREDAGRRTRLQRVQTRMLDAQRAVRTAKQMGQPYGHLATAARAARAEYLHLMGGLEHRTVTVAESSTSNKIKAVD